MDVLHARCCGLEVHQKTAVACVLLTAANGTVQRQVRTFGTMTADRLALNDWLNALQVAPVALESIDNKYCAIPCIQLQQAG